MPKRDGREIARANEMSVLKALHKFAWLRTRDLAALIWMRSNNKAKSGEFTPAPVIVEQTAWRMAQRTLARLRKASSVIWREAPDGSMLYSLAEAGARQLVVLGIPARSGKDVLRRVSQSHYHHRRLANEIAIIGLLQGNRVSTEREIASGQWFGGKDGVAGKLPDVIVRRGQDVVWIEVERSRKNIREAAALPVAMASLWSGARHPSYAPDLPGGYKLKKVLFVCESAFINHLAEDMRKLGWTIEMIAQRLSAVRCLYTTQAKFLIREHRPSSGTACGAV